MKENKKEIGFKYAWAGLRNAFKTERNFRIHLIVAVSILLFSFLMKINRIEWLIIITAITLVIITELINSVFERIIDYLKPEKHIHAKEIKDISAGIVLIATMTSVVMGGIVFVPKIINFF